MTVRRYVLLNVGLAAMNGVFIGPALWVFVRIRVAIKRCFR
jgi:hypothetical protein